MNNYDLSILIPARNEMFISETVKKLVANIRGKTEVIVVLDGQLAWPSIDPAPNVTVLYFPQPRGQRGATNAAAKLSRAKYVMKLDAHCLMDEGFDTKLMADMATLEASGKYDYYTLIPTLYNLHGFDWVCIGKHKRSGEPYEKIEWFKDKKGCGHRIYQSPTPDKCPHCGGNMEREFIFKRRESKRSWYYRFDKNLHFQYWGSYKDRVDETNGNLVEIMSTQGSCFMMTREIYHAKDMSDEVHYGKVGWGQQGVEVALKTWLGGGGLYTTKSTWYSHLFRTQGGDFGFPYPLSGSDQEKARKYSQSLWLNDSWKLAVHPFQWVIDKFAPIPDWHDPTANDNKRHDKSSTLQEKGIVFYTHNKVQTLIGKKVQKQLLKMGLPIVSSSLKPMPHFGTNIHINKESGYITMFEQMLAALKTSTAKYVFMCEADVLYHPSHFEFTPPRDDAFYYNINVWKVNNENGHAVRVDVAQQVSGLCANRELLVKEYQNRLNRVQRMGEFQRGWGFEPGTKSIKRGGFSNLEAINWESGSPNIDIRGHWNVTQTRWSPSEYRNPVHAKGWKESNIIPGWPQATYFDILRAI